MTLLYIRMYRSVISFNYMYNKDSINLYVYTIFIVHVIETKNELFIIPTISFMDTQLIHTQTHTHAMLYEVCVYSTAKQKGLFKFKKIFILVKLTNAQL